MMVNQSLITSLKTIEAIIDQYHDEIEALEIHSIELSAFDTVSRQSSSPFVSRYRLDMIQNDNFNLKIELNKFKSNKNYTQVAKKLNDLSNLTDERIYVNNKLIDKFIRELNKDMDNGPIEVEQDEQTPTAVSKIEINTDDDLSQLRQRLLSKGKGSNLLDQNSNTQDMNNYHESFQKDILNDLSDLSQVLKNSAIKFSTKIFEDSMIVSDTEQHMIENSSFSETISNNLNKYLGDKNGNKVSLIWLLKVFGLIFMSFLLLVLLIKVLPSM